MPDAVIVRASSWMLRHCLLLQEGGLLVLPGARAALAGTPGMIGYVVVGLGFHFMVST